MNQKFGIRDCLFLGSLFLFGMVLTIGIYCFAERGSKITITVDGQLYGTYALREPQEIPVELEGRLANVVMVGVLYLSDWRDAALVSFSRVLLAGFFFGNLYSILYSLAGAVFSLVVMTFIKKTEKLHLISVSAAGGIAHNVGQFLVAAFVVENYRILYYFPVLFLVGMATGVLIGVAATGVLKRLPLVMWQI